jgi:3-oxoacyl-[acyl-carrier protein] reductase
MNVLDLTGKVALITGASRGIGRETALRMADAGARVVVNYCGSESDAQEAVARIGSERAISVRADVSSPDDVQHLISAAVDAFGGIDIVVNNAAIYADNAFDRPEYDEWVRGWERTFAVNVFGAANVAFLAMRAMRARGGGKIINVASRAAFRGETDFADYGASKAALVNLTRSIARACAKDNIVASCVAPGFIETDMAVPHWRRTAPPSSDRFRWAVWERLQMWRR